jgi:hypothetical protein
MAISFKGAHFPKEVILRACLQIPSVELRDTTPDNDVHPCNSSFLFLP